MADGQELLRNIAAAGSRIDPGLSDWDVERLVTAARRRRERRATMLRAVLAAGATAVLVLTGALAIHPARRVPVVGLTATPPADTTLRLSDGSTAVRLDAETQIELVEERSDRVRLSLLRGRGEFQVVRRPQRAFSVRAGDVTITVVGTSFTVERIADRVGVAVQRGTVRVDWGAGSALVMAGNSGWYPPLVKAADEVTVASKALPAARPPRAKVASLATARDDKAAAELLSAADRARLSGHPDEGADLLRKLLLEHAGDPRAPLAAFTLGRLLLMELGHPDEAARVFAQARRLAPAGPFAEDALAREVEALSNAGRPADALTRAQEYQRLYPNGRRLDSVRSVGGMK